MSGPAVCRCCGSSDITLRGRKRGEFLAREFEFYICGACGFMSVEPFSGYEIYNDAYYRGDGPDPYVDYEAEYHDWRRNDRMLEFEDLAGLAEAHVAAAGKDLGTLQRPLRAPRRVAMANEDLTGTAGLRPDGGSASGRLSLVPSSTAAPLRLLDFGCGAGGFLKYLRARGSLHGRPLELSGHDVGSYADLLKNKDGFRILDGNGLLAEPDEHYDVISMIEVIEHVPDPIEPMQTIARLLKPGGLLLLTTGNLESPIARRQGIHFRYCANETHVSLFNPRCLTHLYRHVGLQARPVRYHGTVKFKVLKSLRHRRALRAIASAALRLPALVRAVDTLYGVSAMPCAVKAKNPAGLAPAHVR